MLCKVVGLLFPDDAGDQFSLPRAVQGPATEDAAARRLLTLDITDLLRRSRVNEVIVALSHAPTPEIRTLMSRIRDMGIAPRWCRNPMSCTHPGRSSSRLTGCRLCSYAIRGFGGDMWC